MATLATDFINPNNWTNDSLIFNSLTILKLIVVYFLGEKVSQSYLVAFAALNFKKDFGNHVLDNKTIFDPIAVDQNKCHVAHNTFTAEEGE